MTPRSLLITWAMITLILLTNLMHTRRLNRLEREMEEAHRDLLMVEDSLRTLKDRVETGRVTFPRGGQ
jgi:hypothetical protein